MYVSVDHLWVQLARHGIQTILSVMDAGYHFKTRVSLKKEESFTVKRTSINILLPIVTLVSSL